MPEVRAVIYGAGDNARKLINLPSAEMPYQVCCFVDKNEALNGMRIDKYEIRPVESLRELDFDIVIISIDNWRGVTEVLIQEYDIEERCIYVFDCDNHRFQQMEEAIADDEAARIQVKRELIEELYESGELNGYHHIVVVGDETEVQFVKAFFKAFKPQSYDVYDEKDGPDSQDVKYVFVGRDYREKISLFKTKGLITDLNWNFVPLFDV